MKTYTFEDVVNTLNQVAPYDWRGFWTERLTNHGPGAPLGGIEGSGWKLVYDDTRSELVQAREGEQRYRERRLLDRPVAERGRTRSPIPSKACRRRRRESVRA